jgi:hypothetical protein
MGETFDHYRERQQRVRAVVDSVRADRRGGSSAEIAAELSRRLVAAGLPELPEDVENQAALIANLPGALVSLGLALVRVVAGRPGPAGLRRQSRHLEGTTWCQVEVADEALAQRTLRIYRTMLPSNAREISIGRIVALPGTEVAVFLGSTFIGLLPSEPARAVRQIAQETDAADQKLMVKCQIVGTDGSQTLAVALP